MVSKYYTDFYFSSNKNPGSAIRHHSLFRYLVRNFKVYHHLTPEEEARNVRGSDRLFVGKNHNLFDMINELVETKDAERGIIILTTNFVLM